MVSVDKSIEIDKSKLSKAIVEILDKMEEYEKIMMMFVMLWH